MSMNMTMMEASMAGKSDGELMNMAQAPDDWQPAVLELARKEMARRGITNEDLAAHAAETARIRAAQPLSGKDKFKAALCGIFLGIVIGYFVVRWMSSRFKAEGCTLKAAKIWNVFVMAWGAKTLALVLLYMSR